MKIVYECSCGGNLRPTGNALECDKCDAYFNVVKQYICTVDGKQPPCATKGDMAGLKWEE